MCGLMRLGTAFVQRNPTNQRTLHGFFPDLESLADDVGSERGRELSKLARGLIFAMLRNNERLVERVGIQLTKMMAGVLNDAEDVSTSPALEYFFTISKPEGRPLRGQQVRGPHYLPNPPYS